MLGGISLREVHPQEWAAITSILWFSADDAEYVAEEAVGGQQAEEPVASPDLNALRLSTITEEPRD